MAKYKGKQVMFSPILVIYAKIPNYIYKELKALRLLEYTTFRFIVNAFLPRWEFLSIIFILLNYTLISIIYMNNLSV